MFRGARIHVFSGLPVFLQLEIKAVDEKWSIFCPFICIIVFRV